MYGFKGIAETRSSHDSVECIPGMFTILFNTEPTYRLPAGLQVDMVLSGHVHNYQRTCSVFKNTCVPAAADGSNQAPVWIVNGNAGQWLSTAEPVVPPFYEAVAIEHGYLRYHVNRTSLYAEVWSS